MRLVGLVLLAALSGCMTFGVNGGLSAPLGGAPARPLSGAFEVGAHGGSKRFILNPFISATLGPLGDASEAVGEYGARAFYKHPGFAFAPYARVTHGNNCQKVPCQEITSVSLGLAALSTTTEDAIIDDMVVGFGAASLGFVYRHQRQDDIGEGDFLGIEMTLMFGFETFSMIKGAIDEHERKKYY